MSRLRELLWQGSLLGALACNLLLSAWGVPAGWILAFGFYLLSASHFSGNINLYRKQERDYFANNPVLQFLIGFFGPFYLIWRWIFDLFRSL